MISRVDGSGVKLDNRFEHMGANGSVTPFLPVSKGGETSAYTLLSAPAACTGTFGTGQVSAAFVAVTGADRYEAEAWLNSNPNAKVAAVGTGSPIVVTGLAAGASSVRVKALGDTGREDGFVQGAFSPTATGTVL